MGVANDAGYEISILPLNDKGIHTEVPFLNFDRPHGSVPVIAEILAGRAQIGGRVSYGGNLGCNMRGDLDLTCRTKTTVELGVSEGDLVTTPSLPTRTERDNGVGGAQGVPGNNTNPPLHQDGQR